MAKEVSSAGSGNSQVSGCSDRTKVVALTEICRTGEADLGTVVSRKGVQA